MKIHVHIDRRTDWRWSRMGDKGKVLSTSAPYPTKVEALAAAHRFACGAEVVEVD